MKIYHILILPFFVFSTGSLFAQNTISGKITSQGTGEPLTGVSVLIKNSTTGTLSDAAGGYQIEASPSDSLVFSYIGFKTVIDPVGDRTVMDVSLQSSSKGLDEVVVTALGIEQKAASVAYTSQTISNEEITRIKTPNPMEALTGQIAGATITTGAAPGSSTKVTLRGLKSISGSNQPLFVIDGVPMNNVTGAQGSDMNDTRDGGDNLSSLNSDDIESMNILTGASGSALYGSAAANGVIIITTKKAKAGFTDVNVSSSVGIMNPMVLPHLQTTYGQGHDGVSNTSITDNWGPKITNGSDNHIKDFFETGVNLKNSLSVSSGTDQFKYYLSYSNTNSQGIIPNEKYNRNNLTVRGTSNFFDNKVTVTGSVMYSDIKASNRPSMGLRASPIFSLYTFPIEDDLSKYKEFETFNPARSLDEQNWPYIHNDASSNQNPYWIQYRNPRTDKRSRSITNITVSWKMLDWLTLQGRGTLDKTNSDVEQKYYATTDPIITGANGGYQKNPGENQQLYADLLLIGNKELSSDLSLDFTLGTSRTQHKSHSINLATDQERSTLKFVNFFSVYALTGDYVHTESLTETLQQAIFGTATLGYKNSLFLNVTGRNEWASTTNPTFFYPSVGLSYVLTNSLEPSSFLSFAKLRATYAEVGNALPFGVAEKHPNRSLSVNGNVNATSTLPFFEGTDTIDLKPERSRSFEFGGDFRFFNDQLNLSLTYYHAQTFDQVFSIKAPVTAGVSNFYINGGTILNKGFEATAAYNVRLGDLSWKPRLNFSTNRNRIVKLSDLLETDRIVQQSTFRLIFPLIVKPGSAALDGKKKYGSYGDLFGNVYIRDDKGDIVYDSNTGLPQRTTSDDHYLGNSNPKFLLGFGNTFSYKNFVLSFLIDSRFGGVIGSKTEQWFDYKGLSQRTAAARENGGVLLENGNTVDAEDYYVHISGAGQNSAVASEYIYSMSNVRLRNFSLGYNFDVKSVFKELGVNLSGQNLFFFHKEAPFDPEVMLTTNNTMLGVEAFQGPSLRSFTITLNAKF